MSTHSQIIVHKAAGDWQYFSGEKLGNYLKHIGLHESESEFVINNLLKRIGKDVRTKEIAAHVTSLLMQLPKGQRYAATYNIKESLRKLGPEGHNFELFVGRLFRKDGYTVQTGQIVAGECVEHEVDVIATKGNEQHLIECKFHNTEGKRSDVVVALYTHARHNDIRAANRRNGLVQQGWLATNTKLTIEALKYVKCQDMRLLSVENPSHGSILHRAKKDLIFPISSSTHLDAYLPLLLSNDVVLLEEILEVDVDRGLAIGVPANVLLAAQAEAKAILS
jgi:hypothetical protein